MSQNFFAALDDSGDEAPTPSKSTVKKREPKATKKAVAAPKEVSKGDDRRRPNNDDRNNDARNTKHGRGGDRGDRAGRGERVAPRDGKRAYDRRSGTGRGKEIRKGGGGARNWGSDKADAKKMEGTINEDDVKAEKPVEVSTEGEVAVEKEAPVEEKPEDKTMTFAEYMAVKGKKEETAVRDLEDEFKGLSASTYTAEDFLVMGGGKQKKSKKKKEAEKKSVEVGFRVAKDNDGGGRGDRDDRDDRGDRGGRGGRGGRDGRGRGGRGGRDGRGRGGRGGRDGRGRGGGGATKGKNAGINVQDETAFPSL